MEHRIRKLVWIVLAPVLFARGIDQESIAYKIYQNECAANPKNLIHWNEGENFPSLGIGHFIWYPNGVHDRFEESFPKLIRFMKAKGIRIPAWLEGAAPWHNRAQMQQDPRLPALRRFLTETMALQALFLSDGLDATLARMLEGLTPAQKAHLRYNFQRLHATAGGDYLLIDYRNFKGEGTNPKEQYNHQGWGLRQVLLCMPQNQPAKEAFAKCARQLLEKRIQNAPPKRNESRWRAGWFRRIDTYLH